MDKNKALKGIAIFGAAAGVTGFVVYNIIRKRNEKDSISLDTDGYGNHG